MEHLRKVAIGYLEQAQGLLEEKGRNEAGLYQDRRIVKRAGATAYLGVLVALDRLLGVRKKGSKSVEWYQSELSKFDKRISGLFDVVYKTLYLSMGYGGNPSSKIAQVGLEEAERLINWVEGELQKM